MDRFLSSFFFFLFRARTDWTDFRIILFFCIFFLCLLDEFHRFTNILFVIGIIIKGFCLPHYFR